MTGASEALAGATEAALREVEGLNGVHVGRPVQAATPYALVEAGPELDWGHKSGVGREVRMAIVLRGAGERPGSLGTLAAAAEAAIEALDGELDGWRLVSLRFQRARLIAEAKGEWASTSEYRARMLKS